MLKILGEKQMEYSLLYSARLVFWSAVEVLAKEILLISLSGRNLVGFCSWKASR